MNPLKFAAKAVKALFVPSYRFSALAKLGYYDSMSDEEYLKRKFRCIMGKDLNLDEPKTFCEKLQWLKLYDRKPEYTTMVDKYAVKKFVADRIGDKYIIPLLGVWDKSEDIDFDSLPDQFILKCTHDSGGFVVCRDKSNFNRKKACETLNKYLARRYYYSGREWPYKNVKPRILAEKYIASLGKPETQEYKLTCFNGTAKLITICRGIAHARLNQRTNDHYDRNLNSLRFWVNYKNPKTPEKIPEQIHEIISLSEKLSANIPSVRVDWYIDKDNIYFGEFTFFTWSGFMKFHPAEYDDILGSWLELPVK